MKKGGSGSELGRTIGRALPPMLGSQAVREAVLSPKSASSPWPQWWGFGTKAAGGETGDRDANLRTL
jgi:hypothetical protein